MSSGCGDVLSLADLQTAKKHQIFEAEVITGKAGGVASGASIDYATNAVTGQTQKTLPAVLRDSGFRPASFTFATGGTLGVNDADMAVLWPGPTGDGNYYVWHGALPKTIPASSTPASTGGVSDTAWVPLGDITLRGQLEGSVIDAATNKTFGALTRDVEFFGAVGDGVAIDNAAWLAAAAWVTGGNYRHLTTREGKIYKITSPINFNFANGRGHSICMKSPIRPAAGTGTAFTIQNTHSSQFVLRVDGGGDANAGYNVPSSPNFVDYRTADPVGKQQAFLIRGTRNCKADVFGLNYKGRVLRTMGLDAASGAIFKQSFFTLNINTGDANSINIGPCGQGMYLQGDNSAWGKIGTAFINWDDFGSVVEKVADIAADHIEFAAQGVSGFEFRGIATAHLGTLAGGDETNTNTVLLFKPADDGTQCVAVYVNRIFCHAGKIGVEFRGSNGANSGINPNFTADSVYADFCTEAGVVLNGCNNSWFRHINVPNNNVGLRFDRVSRNVRAGVDILGATTNTIACSTGADMDEVYISGRAFGNTGAATIKLDNAASVGHVVFNDMTVFAPNVAYAIPVSNNVDIRGGNTSFSTAGGMYSVGAARSNKDIQGFVTRTRGAFSIAAGNQSIVVTHGLARTPTEIICTPASNQYTVRVVAIGATTFTINVSAVVGVGSTFDGSWTASCEYR